MKTTTGFNIVTFQEILEQAREWATPDIIWKHKKEFDEKVNERIILLIKRHKSNGYTIKYQ